MERFWIMVLIRPQGAFWQVFEIHSWIPHALLGDNYNDWSMEVSMTLCCFIMCDIQCFSGLQRGFLVQQHKPPAEHKSLCQCIATHLMVCGNTSSVTVSMSLVWNLGYIVNHYKKRFYRIGISLHCFGWYLNSMLPKMKHDASN